MRKSFVYGDTVGKSSINGGLDLEKSSMNGGIIAK